MTRVLRVGSSIGARLVLGSSTRLRARVLPSDDNAGAVGSRADERVRIAYQWPPTAAVLFEPVTYHGEPVTYRGDPVVVRVR